MTNVGSDFHSLSSIRLPIHRRVNRTIKTMVAQYIKDKQTTWDEFLPELNLATNSSVSNSTGSAFVIQGRKPRLPGALYHKVTPAPSEVLRAPVA